MPAKSKAVQETMPQRRKRGGGQKEVQNSKVSDFFPSRRRGAGQQQAKKVKQNGVTASPPKPLSNKAPKLSIAPQPAKVHSQASGKPKTGGATRAAGRISRRFLEGAEVDGETYRVGDSAYVVMEPGEYESEEEVEPCKVCQKARKMRNRKEVPLLECDRCLQGFHLDCLDPPLATVPEDEWLCESCAAGKPMPPPQSGAQNARQKLMAGQLSLIRIEAIWREADDDTLFFSGRWYCLPEETHTGRQRHHGAREIFLTQLVDNNEMEVLYRTAGVCAPSSLNEYDGKADVFVCEYEYDTLWKRFRKLNEENLEESDDAEWAASGGDSSAEEEPDQTFKPIYALWAEKGMIAAKNMRGRGRSRSTAALPARVKPGRKHRIQGGELWTAGKHENMLAGLGACQIPETARIASGSDLCRARSALALAATPKTLACREPERDIITSFVVEAVGAGPDCQGRCLYVSGVPGTGKTATVLEVMRTLRRRATAGELPHFQFVEMNSLRLPSPSHAYSFLYEALTGQHLGPGAALPYLEEMFNTGSGKRRGVTVLLVDEMDQLVTRNQQVLYNLFEWPTRRSSMLAVIGIANTMDLPERLLPKIASRLGGRRVAFQPYTRQQLVAIVNARLESAGLAATFADNAVNMACSKVAGVTGDVRRVLQLCRKATEICEEEKCSQVAMRHINLAVEEMFSAAHMQLLSNCCRLEKMLLAALLLEVRAKGRADATMEEVAFRLQHLAEARGEQHLCFGDCLAAAHRLGAKRLLFTEMGAKRLGMRISLYVPNDDVVDVLHNDASIPWLKDLHL